jgi:hypothetical protein
MAAVSERLARRACAVGVSRVSTGHDLPFADRLSNLGRTGHSSTPALTNWATGPHQICRRFPLTPFINSAHACVNVVNGRNRNVLRAPRLAPSASGRVFLSCAAAAVLPNQADPAEFCLWSRTDRRCRGPAGFSADGAPSGHGNVYRTRRLPVSAESQEEG